jgi:transcriptional regulator with XRE-family HTH domain
MRTRNAPVAYGAPMGGRSITREENARIIAAIRELLRRGETQVGLAKKVHVNQATLSSLLARRHSAGYAFARSLASVLGVPVGALLNGDGSGATTPTPWRDLQGWAAAEAEGRRAMPRVSDDAWRWLGSLMGPPLPGLPPLMLAMLASIYDQAAPPAADAPSSPVSTVRVRQSKA